MPLPHTTKVLDLLELFFSQPHTHMLRRPITRFCASPFHRPQHTLHYRQFSSTKVAAMPTIIANRKRLYYKDWTPKTEGSPRGTIVFIHGLGSSNNYYFAIVQQLITHGYRCICMDTTGSARSPFTFYEQTTNSLAADAVGLMDELKIAKAVIVGHSMAGGLTGPELAAQWPDRVSSLILLGPVYPSEAMTPVFEQRIEAVQKDGMEAMGDTIPWGAVGSNANDLQRAFIRELLTRQDPQGYISLCRVIAYSHKTPPTYGKVSCPTLIIAGEEDKSAPLDGCKKILAELGAQKKDMVVQNKVGHWMAVEVPDDCAQQILKFLQ